MTNDDCRNRGTAFVLGRSSFVICLVQLNGAYIMTDLNQMGQAARAASRQLAVLSTARKNAALPGDRRRARSAGRNRAGCERQRHRGRPRQGVERGAARPAAAEREAAGRARRRHAPRRHAARSGRRGIRRPRAAQRPAAVQAAHPHRRHRRDLRGAAERHHRYRHALPQDRQRRDPARGQRDVPQQPGAHAGHPGRAGRSPASRRPRCKRSPTQTGRW